jgi:hypothetical protein
MDLNNLRKLIPWGSPWYHGTFHLHPLEESLMGVRTVSAFGTERFQQQRFEEQLGRARKGGIRSGIRRLGGDGGWGMNEMGLRIDFSGDWSPQNQSFGDQKGDGGIVTRLSQHNDQEAIIKLNINIENWFKKQS